MNSQDRQDLTIAGVCVIALAALIVIGLVIEAAIKLILLGLLVVALTGVGVFIIVVLERTWWKK